MSSDGWKNCVSGSAAVERTWMSMWVSRRQSVVCKVLERVFPAECLLLTLQNVV